MGGKSPRSSSNVSKSSAKRVPCSQRFLAGLAAFEVMRSHSIRFVWVTNFRINHHETISNEELHMETACQRRLAATHGIPLLDLWSLVESGDLLCDEGYHLDAASQRKLAAQALRLAFGEEGALDMTCTH